MQLKNVSKLLIITLLLPNFVYTAQDAVVLEKGMSAPYAGILMDFDKARELKNGLVERDTYEKLNESYKRSLDLQTNIINKKDDSIKILLDQNDSLSKNLYAERQTSDLTKILIFSSGVLATILIMYGVQKTK